MRPAGSKVGVGLFGMNGHQVHARLADHPWGELVAVAAFDRDAVPAGCSGVRCHETLDELLGEDGVDLVCLCSPRRADQAGDAVRALCAGKHVYGEKPSALTEADLDEILRVARGVGKQYREMGGTAMEPPYRALREVVQDGMLGEVVQVLGQKSYPWHDGRPDDEAVDGGLALQVGVYATRFVEHVACEPIAEIDYLQTDRGHPRGAAAMAGAFRMRLERGGIAGVICNYLNPREGLPWGFEMLRIFGTLGFADYEAGRGDVRLCLHGEYPRRLETGVAGPTHFDAYLRALCGGEGLPMTEEEEIRPVRWAIRATQGKECSAVGPRGR